MQWIAKLPTTNFRTLVGVCVSVLFVLAALISDALGRPLQSETLWTLGSFLLLQMGLDVTQFTMKRRTFQTEAHVEGAVREAAEPPPPVPAVAERLGAAQPAAATGGRAGKAQRADGADGVDGDAVRFQERRRGERRGGDRRLGGEPLALSAREMQALEFLQSAPPVERVGARGDRVVFHPLGSHPSLLDDGRGADDGLDHLGTPNAEALS